MARGLGLLTKWLFVPAALAAAGYFVVGPRLGAAPEKVRKPVEGLVASVADRLNPKAGQSAPVRQSATEPGPSSPGVGSGSKVETKSEGPEVDVTVDGRSTSGSPESHARRRPRHRRTHPKAKPKPKAAADEGSYGGLQDNPGGN